MYKNDLCGVLGSHFLIALVSVPLYINFGDRAEIGYGNTCLNIVVIQLWIM